MKRLFILPFALCTLIACKSNNKPNTEPGSDNPAPLENAPAAAGADDTAGCGTYATIATKCAGSGDAKALEATCVDTIKKNDGMTASMRAMVKCATTTADCDAYTKCLPTP
jgi:hypothetical protein